MPDMGDASNEARVHAREQEFTLNVKERGHFTVLSPVGRYSDTLLGVLVQDFMDKPAYLAVDLSRLEAVTLPLIRAFYEYAVGLGREEGRLVLLRPPDKIRGLVKLVAKQDVIPIVLSERDLEGDTREIHQRMTKSADRLDLVRRQLEKNPSWQFVDADCRWLCPFCATLRTDIRMVTHGAPTPGVIDRVCRHLAEECTTYSEGSTEGWPRDVLERTLSHANAELAQQSSEHRIGRNSSRILRLEEKQKKADELQKGDLSASEARRRLLPASPPALAGFDLGMYYLPADLMGGDFYNFVGLGGGRMGIVVGDVSVHDLDAGVLMGMARKVLSLRLREAGDPLKALSRANEDLYEELDRQSYATAVVAILDGERREVRLSTAGHVLPFLARVGPPPEVVRMEPAGPVLGLAQGQAFEQGLEARTLSLKAGDVLLLHTSGLEHVKNSAGAEFGADRVAAVLKTHALVDARLILGALALEVEQFCKDEVRHADISAICVKAL